MTIVVDVADVSKDFKIHYERHQSLKERLLHPKTGSTEDFSALEEHLVPDARGRDGRHPGPQRFG